MTAQKLIKSYTEIKTLMDSYTVPAGELDKKYNVIVFKAKKGNYSYMKRTVNNYIKNYNKDDIIVMEDMDDNLVKSWLVGNKNDIARMVNDSLKQQPI